jgi:hypothetical protein
MSIFFDIMTFFFVIKPCDQGFIIASLEELSWDFCGEILERFA